MVTKEKTMRTRTETMRTADETMRTREKTALTPKITMRNGAKTWRELDETMRASIETMRKSKKSAHDEAAGWAPRFLLGRSDEAKGGAKNVGSARVRSSDGDLFCVLLDVSNGATTRTFAGLRGGSVFNSGGKGLDPAGRGYRERVAIVFASVRRVADAALLSYWASLRR